MAGVGEGLASEIPMRDAAWVMQPNESSDLRGRDRVVLLHGLASSHRIWERVIPLLGKDCAAGRTGARRRPFVARWL
jgi:pimeloyl-ACP methyl ester carboxylesterase